MKRIALFLSALVLLYTITSCNDDNTKEIVVTESNYNFSFIIRLSDIHCNNLLSQIKSDDSFNVDDISIRPLQENDNVTVKTIVDQTVCSAGLVADETVNSAKLLVDIDSYGSDGIITHEFVIQYDKNNSKTTDTITCEIDKNKTNILCKSILVNNIRKSLADGSFPQSILIMKTAPSVYNSIDKDNYETLIEKEVDGLKFSFWLSDMDDKTTNIFDEKDIRERGFKFNMSLTNNTDRNVFTKNEFGPYLSDVFDINNNYKGRSCRMFDFLLRIDKIQPGETRYESIPWCSYDVNNPDIELLPVGKYYTYFSKSYTYEHGDNYDNFDHTKTNTTRKTIDIPLMYINFEVK